MSDTLVPTHRLRAIVERWIAEHDSPGQAFLELEANSPWKADSWRRRFTDTVQQSRRGTWRGWWTYYELALEDVDEFLTAAGLTYLWQTELRDLLPETRPTDEEFDETCALCGRWIDWSRGDRGVRVELKEPGRWTRWWSLCSLCYAREWPRPERRPDCTGQIRTPRISEALLLKLCTSARCSRSTRSRSSSTSATATRAQAR